MAAVEVNIADAVVAELNDPARGFSQSFTAVRKWLPVWEASDLDSLKVAVVPLTLENERVSRDKTQLDYGIAISLQKRVDVSANTNADALTLVAEEIFEFYRAYHVLATQTAYRVIGVQRPDIYDLSGLYSLHTWETLIVLTVRGWR